jgi:gliding motility-associated-like protein
VPSAFSPNNDGMNDVFRTMNSDLTKYRLLIFNRWGEKVFESEDPADGWDGRFKGFPQDIGVYVYQIEYQTPSSSVSKLLSGNLTLVR